MATITWLKYYLHKSEHMDSVIDHFMNISDEELEAEKTHRAKQMMLWQFYCLKPFGDLVDQK